MHHPDELLRLLRTWSPALDANERLLVLAALVAYWHGARWLTPPSVEANVALPAGLRWLYAEIGARNRSGLAPHAPGWVRGDPLVIFNNLRDPRCFEVDEAGQLTFLIEHQGVFCCGVPADAPDGPVVRQELDSTAWNCCADTLTDFLLWAIVYELRVCREHTVWGLFSPAEAARITAPLVPVNVGNVSTYGTRHRIWHARDLVVLTTPSGNEICVEAVARGRGRFEQLRTLAAWADG